MRLQADVKTKTLETVPILSPIFSRLPASVLSSADSPTAPPDCSVCVRARVRACVCACVRASAIELLCYTKAVRRVGLVLVRAA